MHTIDKGEIMIKNLKIVKTYQKAVIIKRVTISSVVAILVGCGVVDTLLKEKATIYVENDKYLSDSLYYVIDTKKVSHICLQETLMDEIITKGYYQLDTNELVATSNLYGDITASDIVPIKELVSDFTSLNQYIDNDYGNLLEYADNLYQSKKILSIK